MNKTKENCESLLVTLYVELPSNILYQGEVYNCS